MYSFLAELGCPDATIMHWQKMQPTAFARDPKEAFASLCSSLDLPETLLKVSLLLNLCMHAVLVNVPPCLLGSSFIAALLLYRCTCCRPELLCSGGANVEVGSGVNEELS